MSSRLISRPTSRKNSAIRPSLIGFVDADAEGMGRERAEIEPGKRRVGEDQCKRRREHEHEAAGGLARHELSQNQSWSIDNAIAYAFQEISACSILPEAVLLPSQETCYLCG